jgi:hypothetical protein
MPNAAHNEEVVVPEVKPKEKPEKPYRDRFRSGWSFSNYRRPPAPDNKKQFTGKVSTATEINEIK